MKEQDLMKKAIEARERAYVPYSNFKVGAAVLGRDGQVYTGCNIENAAYGPTNCAERTAIFKAVSEGVLDFSALAVVADTEDPVTPCGVCRQVMAEFFGPETPVFLGNLRGEISSTTLGDLLPGAFTKKELRQEGGL